jgi:alcohol dehydrogenase class IV
MRFEFATATRIIFGAGTLAEIGTAAASFGQRALVVTRADQSSADPLLDLLSSAGIDTITYAADGEPTINAVLEGVRRAREGRCDLVIGFGGGSVIDMGKAVAALITNPGDPLDYLEVIGRGQALTQPPLPYIAMPTTAGTGSEVTRNAVLGSPEHRVKVSLRSPLMLPKIALVDPELTYNLPPEITAYTGLDALTQVIEPFVCNQPAPLTDAICREGIRRASYALLRAYEHGGDTAAREDMALVSLSGGLALANARLGAVHGFAGPFGGMFDAPHGAVCAALLPHVITANIAALKTRQPDSAALKRYDEVAQLLTGDRTATAADGAEWIGELCEMLHVPGLSAYGVTKADLADLIEKSARSSSMKGNPIALTPDEMRGILTQAL